MARVRSPILLEALIAAELAFLLYWSNAQVVSPTDANAHVYSAWSMVWEGNAELGEFRHLRPPFEFRQHAIGDAVYAPYLPGNALLFAPLALVAGLLGLEASSLDVAGVQAKLLTSLAVAVAVAAMHLVVARRAGRRAALYVSCALAFGTFAASVASQVLYEHGTSLALLAVGLALAFDPRRAALAGLPLGLALVVRPTNIFPAAAIVASLAHARPSSAARAVLWMAPSLAFFATFNALTFGTPTLLGRPLPEIDPGSGGLIGLLVSPSRGLFVYSPFLAVAVVALIASWRWAADQTVWLLRYGSLAFLATLAVFGTYVEWWGGSQYGHRYLGDLLPVYGIALGEAFSRGWIRTWPSRVLFAAAIAWGVLLQLLGMSMSYLEWHGVHWGLTPMIDETSWRLWSWTDPEWLFFLRRLVNEPPIPAFLSTAALVLLLGAFAYLARRATAGAPRPSEGSPAG